IDVHHDRFARVQRSVPGLMWIRSLWPWRTDRRLRRVAAAREQRGFDDRAQLLRGEDLAVETKHRVGADRRTAQRIHAFLPRFLRRALGRLEARDLVLTLDAPAYGEILR